MKVNRPVGRDRSFPAFRGEHICAYYHRASVCVCFGLIDVQMFSSSFAVWHSASVSGRSDVAGRRLVWNGSVNKVLGLTADASESK